MRGVTVLLLKVSFAVVSPGYGYFTLSFTVTSAKERKTFEPFSLHPRTLTETTILEMSSDFARKRDNSTSLLISAKLVNPHLFWNRDFSSLLRKKWNVPAATAKTISVAQMVCLLPEVIFVNFPIYWRGTSTGHRENTWNKTEATPIAGQFGNFCSCQSVPTLVGTAGVAHKGQ